MFFLLASLHLFVFTNFALSQTSTHDDNEKNGKILVIADSHDVSYFKPLLLEAKEQYAALFVAGDLGFKNMDVLVEFMNKNPDFPVVILPGNHDIGDTDVSSVMEWLGNEKITSSITVKQGGKSKKYSLSELYFLIENKMREMYKQINGNTGRALLSLEKYDDYFSDEEKNRERLKKFKYFTSYNDGGDVVYWEVTNDDDKVQKYLKYIGQLRRIFKAVRGLNILDAFLSREDVKTLIGKRALILDIIRKLTLRLDHPDEGSETIDIVFNESRLPLKYKDITFKNGNIKVRVVPKIYFSNSQHRDLKVLSDFVKTNIDETTYSQFISKDEDGIEKLLVVLSHISRDEFENCSKRLADLIGSGTILFNGHTHTDQEILENARVLQSISLVDKDANVRLYEIDLSLKAINVVRKRYLDFVRELSKYDNRFYTLFYPIAITNYEASGGLTVDSYRLKFLRSFFIDQAVKVGNYNTIDEKEFMVIIDKTRINYFMIPENGFVSVLDLMFTFGLDKFVVINVTNVSEVDIKEFLDDVTQIETNDNKSKCYYVSTSPKKINYIITTKHALYPNAAVSRYNLGVRIGKLLGRGDIKKERHSSVDFFREDVATSLSLKHVGRKTFFYPANKLVDYRIYNYTGTEGNFLNKSLDRRIADLAKKAIDCFLGVEDLIASIILAR